MRCVASLQRELERLEHALKDLRMDLMNSGHPNNFKMMLNEANLQGQIKAIEHALGSDPGDWPHDAWFAFVDARRQAIHSLVKAGKSFPEVLETLNLTEIQARLTIVVDDTSDRN